MRILCCPANNYRQETADSLSRYAPNAEIVNVVGDQNNYWTAIRERWNASDDLLVIEQDIAFTAIELEEIDSCPEPWCVFGYLHYRDKPESYLERGLGFTRFRKELMAKVPVNEIPCTKTGSIIWWHVDSRIYHTSWRYGYRPHNHGTVEHFHYEGATD
jgi:hypothetical protein